MRTLARSTTQLVWTFSSVWNVRISRKVLVCYVWALSLFHPFWLLWCSLWKGGFGSQPTVDSRVLKEDIDAFYKAYRFSEEEVGNIKIMLFSSSHTEKICFPHTFVDERSNWGVSWVWRRYAECDRQCDVQCRFGRGSFSGHCAFCNWLKRNSRISHFLQISLKTRSTDQKTETSTRSELLIVWFVILPLQKNESKYLFIAGERSKSTGERDFREEEAKGNGKWPVGFSRNAKQNEKCRFASEVMIRNE